MPAIPRQLADVIDMIHDIAQTDCFIVFGTLYPARSEHPVIAGDTDHAVTFEDGAYLFVGELALVRHKGAAVVMTCQDAPIKTFERFPKGSVRKVSQIQKDSKLFHPSE